MLNYLKRAVPQANTLVQINRKYSKEQIRVTLCFDKNDRLIGYDIWDLIPIHNQERNAFDHSPIFVTQMSSVEAQITYILKRRETYTELTDTK